MPMPIYIFTELLQKKKKGTRKENSYQGFSLSPQLKDAGTLYYNNTDCKRGTRLLSETEVDEQNLQMMFAMAESAVVWRSAAILLATRSGHEVPAANAVNAMT